MSDKGPAATAHERPGPTGEGKHVQEIPGVVTKPLEEVGGQYDKVSQGQVNKQTFVRLGYAGELEAAINKQIDYHNNLGYIFLAQSAYFDRDSVSLPGISKFFRSCSESEFGSAQEFIDFQNMRGGRVQLLAVPMPDADYFHEQKGDALYAYELALALQKLCMEKMKEWHCLADSSDDFQAQDFIEAKMTEQAKKIKELGNYVCELKRVGKGHGVFHFDERIDARFGGVLSAD